MVVLSTTVFIALGSNRLRAADSGKRIAKLEYAACLRQKASSFFSVALIYLAFQLAQISRIRGYKMIRLNS